MTDQDKTKEDLIQELIELRQRLAKSENSASDRENPRGTLLGLPKGWGTGLIFIGGDCYRTWQPGTFAMDIDVESPQVPTIVDGDWDPFLSWFKEIIHPDDMPQFLVGLDQLVNGTQDSFQTRVRVQTWLGLLGSADFYLLVGQRDEQGKAVGIAGCYRILDIQGLSEETWRKIEELVRNRFEWLLKEDQELSDALSLTDDQGRPVTNKEYEVAALCLCAALIEQLMRLGQAPPSFVKDRSMKYVWVSDSFAEGLGSSPHALYGKTDFEMFGSPSQEEEDTAGEALMSGAEYRPDVTRIVDGVRTLFRDSLQPIRDPLIGQPQWIIGITKLVHKAQQQDEWVSKSPAMQSALINALAAAKSDSPVLLTGESGAGKDYLARPIHDESCRCGHPFFSINCAAIPAGLAESELFGHERGAFTGAFRRKRGLLELAAGGTLLLNEIGELDKKLQANLLTFLDNQTFTRVGGETTVKTDVRLIAATNKDLEEAVSAGEFRGDLLYRINVIRIEVPPLRSRLEDLPFLLQRVLEDIFPRTRLDRLPEIDDACLRILSDYQWPGNIRELRNVLERAVVLSRGETSSFRDILRNSLKTERQPSLANFDFSLRLNFHEDPSDEDLLEETERQLVRAALKRAAGNQSLAQRLLGTSRGKFRKAKERLDRAGSNEPTEA